MKTMQKLQGELKNTPMDVKLFLVHSSVNCQLNKQETVSVGSKVLTCNNSEGIQPRHTEGRILSAIVYVLDINNLPLMPTTPRKAKILLKKGNANVIKRIPFTIKLNYQTTNFRQKINLGIDSGYQNIGFSAVSKNKELISGIVKLDNRTSKRLTEKRMYRRNRRSKLWYRKPRWKNRRRKEGWLPPSIQRRYDTHLNLINKLKKILPITKTIVEVANFDIQKINNPEISSKEYQQGNLYQYQNIKAYLIARENGKCQLCGKEYKNGWHIHHIISKNKGGTDKPDNSALLHKKCHEKLHKQKLFHLLKKNKQYKESTFMNIIKWRFRQDLDCKITFGYKTFVKRNILKLEKTHYNDAFVIADGDNQIRTKPFKIQQRHRHSRVTQLNRKGYKPSIKSHIYKIQPKDLIWHSNKIWKVIGIQNKGAYVKVENSKKVLKVRDIQKIYTFGGLVWA